MFSRDEIDREELRSTFFKVRKILYGYDKVNNFSLDILFLWKLLRENNINKLYDSLYNAALNNIRFVDIDMNYFTIIKWDPMGPTKGSVLTCN